MAKITFQPDQLTHECEDGMMLIDVCEEIDTELSFGCTEGTCGVCELTVVKGRENCNQPNEEEKDYLYEEDLEKGMRLGCQLKIRKGDVTLTWKGNRVK